MNKGIVIAGNLIVDNIKMIDVYPEQSMLCHIIHTSHAVGGMTNTIVDLARLDKSLPLYMVGKVGDDVNGQFVKDTLVNSGVNIHHVLTHPTLPTSYTDVMTVNGKGGARTFFQAQGANAEFGLEDIDFDQLEGDIFHIGYALLLDQFDSADAEYGTVMAHTLKMAQDRGFKTSIDVVSESSDRFKRLVSPCLPYCNYVIINEIESGAVTGISARDENKKINYDNLKKICKKLFELGVKDLVCVHFPEAGVAMDREGNYAVQPSVNITKAMIQGTVGAGDAFCAGMLYSVYNGFDIEKSLKTAACCSACNLLVKDSISGAKSYADTIRMGDIYGWEKL